MKLSKIFLAGAVVLFLLPACKSAYETLLTGNDVEAKYKAAFEFFNNGKYRKAGQLFESMSVLTSGTPQDDTV